ncbi:MAG: NusG domain II-containing protein [Oscillospiraceae bacterium]
MKKISRTNLIAGALVAAMVLGCALWMLWPRLFVTEHPVAHIWVNGSDWRTIDLARAKDETFSIAGETGVNITFEVKDHKICFLHSDCPDKICVRSGWIGYDLDTAACIPNQTAIFVTVE